MPQAYEAAFESSLVGRHAPGTTPLPGAEPLLRRLHPICHLVALVCFLRLGGLGLDADALYNGSVSLLHARGILPDGLPFNMPECDDLPLPRAIADLIPPTRDGVMVLLGIPPLRPNGLNCTLDARATATPAMLRQTRVLHDEISGVDERKRAVGPQEPAPPAGYRTCRRPDYDPDGARRARRRRATSPTTPSSCRPWCRSAPVPVFSNCCSRW